MAHSTSTASSIANVCSLIASFAVTNAGFTNVGTFTDNGEVVQHLSKGGVHYYFGKTPLENSVRSRLAKVSFTVWPTVLPTTSISGSDTKWSMQAFAGPFPSLDLYSDGICVHAVLQLTNGIFNHMSLGKITKIETFTGGEYITSGSYTYAPGGIYQPFDAFGLNYPPFGGSIQQSNTESTYYGCVLDESGGAYGDYRDYAPMGVTGYTSGLAVRGARGVVGSQSILRTLLNSSPNTGNQRATMYPVYIHLYDKVSGLWRESGYVANARVLGMRSLDIGETIYTSWQVWPVSSRNGSGVSGPNTGELALAYLT